MAAALGSPELERSGDRGSDLNLFQALAYFYKEAAVSLVRSWRVSLLAVVTIAVSLFIGGSFLLVQTNLSLLVELWRGESKVMVYLRDGVEPAALAKLTALAAEPSWVRAVESVSAAEAVERFERTFPSLADLVQGWSEDPLPASLEIAIDPVAATGPDFEGWIGQLRGSLAAQMVDDDRDWIRQLETLLAIVGSVGLVLACVLLGAAIFTIASVVRLTAHLYREEIAIMRLVGATEFFIRGPFYVEGLLQGLIGGLLAVAGLQTLYFWMLPQVSSSLALMLVAVRFLSPLEIAGLIGLGGAAGLFGAIVSLRGETLSS